MLVSGCASTDAAQDDESGFGLERGFDDDRFGARLNERDAASDRGGRRRGQRPRRPEAMDDTSGGRATDYAPLAVGATWTYATDVLGDRTKGQVQIRVTDKVDGFYRDTARGEYRHTPSGLRDRIRYLIRHPLRPGNKWKATLSTAAVEHFSIVSVGQPCDTPAGQFGDCLVITAYQRRNAREVQHVTYTWVRGVGLARILVEGEVTGKGRFRQSELALVHYRLKPGEADEDGAPSEWTR